MYRSWVRRMTALAAILAFVGGAPGLAAALQDGEPKGGEATVGAGGAADPAGGRAGVKPAEAGQAAEAKGAEAKGVEAEKGAVRLVRLPIPITDNADERFRRVVSRLLTQLKQDGPPPTLVIEFATGQSKDGAGTSFHRAHHLAEFLISDALQGVKTVAYIPRTVKGHAVLVAMACDEIIMAKDAEIGEAGIDEPNETLIRDRKPIYTTIAERQLTIPPALALGMLDRQVTVLKAVTQNEGTYFVLAEKLDELKKTKNVLSSEALSPRPGLYSGERGRLELTFVSKTAGDRNELAKVLGAQERDLREDPSLDREWKAAQVTIEGEITSGEIAQIQRRVEKQIAEGGANFICLRIDSAGGAPDESQQLANFLARQDPARVRTAAYVAREARGDAALIALACDDLLMNSDAVLGGRGEIERSEGHAQLAVDAFRGGVSRAKSRPWSLPAAMIDPSVKVYRYENKTKGLSEYLSEAEFNELSDKGLLDKTAWEMREPINPGDAALQVDGERAVALGLATGIVKDFNGVKDLYGIEDPALIDPTWVDDLLAFLSLPSVSVFLLLIGGAAVYAELQTPGVGLGGMIAFVCFLLYFWAKAFNGTAGWLEVLLFVSGVGCLLLEVFVLPGSFVFGFGGGLMIIASLVLASQTFIFPSSDYQITQMRDSMLVVGGAAVGIVASIAVMRRYLPHAPVFNRMMLAPPSAEELESLSAREAMADFRHLLGRQGSAVTRLIPSGKVRFGDELVDVVADGEYIEPGRQVAVIEVRGTRVVVRSV